MFGLGFPPFTGGPFHWIDRYGANNLVNKMKEYQSIYGICFEPCPLLQEYASSGKTFFPKK